MKKDHIRDYATAAFRYYAACGCRTSEEIKDQIYQRIFEQSKKDYSTITKNNSYSSSVEYAVMQAEQALERHKAELLDLLAVEMTIRELECMHTKSGICIKQAVEIIYFMDPKKDLQKNDISDRVHRAELSIPASDRQIYRWLKEARVMFAYNRGLRVV